MRRGGLPGAHYDPVARRMKSADGVNPRQQSPELQPLARCRLVACAPAFFREQSVKHAVVFLEELSVRAPQRRNNRDFPLAEFEQKILLVLQCIAAPAAGPIEFHDDPAAVLHFHIIYAVDVAGQRAAQVRAPAIERALDQVQHRVRRQERKIRKRILEFVRHARTIRT